MVTVNTAGNIPTKSVPSVTTSSFRVECTTPSATPTSVTSPVDPPTLYHEVPHLLLNNIVIQELRHPIAMTLLGFHEQQPLPVQLHLSPNLRFFLDISSHTRNPPSSPSTPQSLRSKPWFHEVADHATGTIQFVEAAVASPVTTQCNFHSSTM